MATQTLEIVRHSVRLTKKQKERLTDAVAELIVSYLERHGTDMPEETNDKASQEAEKKT
jgi:hypothetical protein